jgi:hypothetical protein
LIKERSRSELPTKQRGLSMMTRPLRYRVTAAELRDLAHQMRWAENRDHLLHMAEHFAELAELGNELGARADASGAPT